MMGHIHNPHTRLTADVGKMYVIDVPGLGYVHAKYVDVPAGGGIIVRLSDRVLVCPADRMYTLLEVEDPSGS